MFNACVQMFVARFYMAVYFGELCKITFVDKWTCKMVKKKDGLIRYQHNLQIILDCLSYLVSWFKVG